MAHTFEHWHKSHMLLMDLSELTANSWFSHLSNISIQASLVPIQKVIKRVSYNRLSKDAQEIIVKVIAKTTPWLKVAIVRTAYNSLYKPLALPEYYSSLDLLELSTTPRKLSSVFLLIFP